MSILSAEYKDRLRHWIHALSNDLYHPLGGIPLDSFRTFDQLSYAEAKKHAYEPVIPGYTWGRSWEYGWFRGKVKLPAEAEGKRIVVDLQPGGESTLFVNGRSFGTYRAPWVQYQHQYIEDNCLTRSGKAGTVYNIVMETYAGHDYPECGINYCCTGPVLDGGRGLKPAKTEGARVTLGCPTYGIWDEDAYQLFMDVTTLQKLLETLDEKSLRAAEIARALEKFTLTVDFEQPLADRDASYREARKILAPALAAHNGTVAPTFYAVGHAHLDLAWLWPMAETYRKTSRTFAAQLRLINEYPDYKYIQSQPAAYEMVRKYYPELFQRILAAIKKGQWIAEGAMWVEPDTNMPSGEALIRQLLYGKQYFHDVLGVDSRILWLPDTFGYTGALPQILRSCGVDYLVTQKIFWSYNEGEEFPYHYFNWQGIDGTSIQAFLPTSYSYQTDPAEIVGTWNSRRQTQDLDTFLLPFGYGDGGGGPTRDHVEFLEREKDLQGMPRVKMADPGEMFDDLNAAGGPANTYSGELYFNAHRATYTTQAKVKANNRRAEFALREMEFWASAALAAGTASYDSKAAGDLWKELLLHQFHDILPGSGIHRMYEEAEKRVGAVIAQADEKAAEYAGSLTRKDDHDRAITLLNSLSFGREELVTLPDAFADGAKTVEGITVPVQKTAEGVRALVKLPPAGGISLVPADDGSVAEGASVLSDDAAGHGDAVSAGAAGTVPAQAAGGGVAPEQKACVRQDGDGFVMENDILCAHLNAAGEITSCTLLESGREFAAGNMNHFRLFKDVPRNFDAWDLDSNYIDQEIPAAQDVRCRILEAGGLEAVLEVSGVIAHSTFSQKIRLAAGSRRLVFETTIDWKELHRLLKVSFPVNVYATSARNEMQFGYVERPTTRSTVHDRDRFEVCNHKYTALSDGSHGAAILNDCKYGISMRDNELALTLLTASASPDMRADNRVHHFTYAFTAFEGDFMHSDVVEQGYELNAPVLQTPGRTKAFSLVQIDQPNVILDTMKPAEDGSGDLILRFYESKKAAVRTCVTTALAKQAWLCDMLENRKEEIPVKDGRLTLNMRAFGIATVRISTR